MSSLIASHLLEEGPANRSQLCFVNTFPSHILSCFLCWRDRRKMIEFRQSSEELSKWQSVLPATPNSTEPAKYASLVWISASKSGHTAAERRRTADFVQNLNFNKKNKANPYKKEQNNTHTYTRIHLFPLVVLVCAWSFVNVRCPATVRDLCLGEWVWNVNNSNNSKQNTYTNSTPASRQILSRKKNPANVLSFICHRRCHHSFVPVLSEQRKRSWRWEIAVSVAPAEVATLADSSAAERFKQLATTLTHIYTEKKWQICRAQRATNPLKKNKRNLVLFVSQCAAREGEQEYWMILSHSLDETSIFSFIFIFRCY